MKKKNEMKLSFESLNSNLVRGLIKDCYYMCCIKIVFILINFLN